MVDERLKCDRWCPNRLHGICRVEILTELQLARQMWSYSESLGGIEDFHTRLSSWMSLQVVIRRATKTTVLEKCERYKSSIKSEKMTRVICDNSKTMDFWDEQLLIMHDNRWISINTTTVKKQTLVYVYFMEQSNDGINNNNNNGHHHHNANQRLKRRRGWDF